MDLLQDFVFAALNGSVDSSQTSWVVDDATQFPAQHLLDRNDFWLVAESDLLHPPTFEIVKVTAVNLGTNTVTVVRGQQGTEGQAHDDATLVKGALTAAMLKLIRGVAEAAVLPDYDDEQFQPGDRVRVFGDQQLYRFSGNQLQFSNNSAFANGNADSHYLGVLQQMNSEGWMGRGSRWRNTIGVWGTPASGDARPGGSAIYKSGAVGSKAMALVALGSPVFAFQGTIATPATSGANAGVMFACTSDGQSGYYLSFAPGSLPTLHRVVAGVHTAIGTVGPDVVAASSPSDYYTILVDGDYVRVWYQSQANSSSQIWQSLTFTETVNFPRGSFIGFAALDAASIADTALAFPTLGSWAGFGPTTGHAIANSTNFTTPAADDPTSINVPSIFAFDWVNAIGVFGRIGNVAVYESGAVSNQALVVTDLGADSFVLTITFTKGASDASDWGFWVKGDATGQNGYYIQIVSSFSALSTVANLYRVESGTRTLLGTVGSWSYDTTSHFLYLVCDLERMAFWCDVTGIVGDGTYSGLFEMSGENDFSGGQNFGWFLTNATAIADNIAFNGLISAEMNFDSGWVAEPTTRLGSGAPVTQLPSGSTYFDQSDTDAPWLFGQSWQRIQANMQTTTGFPSNYAPAGTMCRNLNDNTVFICAGGNSWVPILAQQGYGNPISLGIYGANSGALFIDISPTGSTGLWFFSTTAGTWINAAGAGAGGGGGGTPIDGYYGVAGTPAVGDFMLQNGALWAALKTDAGSISEPAGDNWPVNPMALAGVNYYWVEAGDASVNGTTADAALTHATNSSAGLIINAYNSIALDNLHIRFQSETYGEGFALSLIPDANSATVVNDSTAPRYRHYGYTVSTTPGGMGIDQAGSTLPTAALSFIFPDDGSTNFSVLTPSGSVSIATPSPLTQGIHDWDVRIASAAYQEKPGSYHVMVYCDGVKIGGSYFEFNGVPDSGWLTFSSLTPATGTAAVNTIRHFVVDSAFEWRRVHVDAYPEPWIALKLKSPWVAAGPLTPAWHRDGSRLFMRGEISGGISSDPICEIEYDMVPESDYHQVWLTAIEHLASGPIQPVVLVYNNGSPELAAFSMTAGSSIHLDGLNWRLNPQ